MNKIADALITISFVLVFGLLFLREKLFGPPQNPPPDNSYLILIIIGFVLTFPISIPCFILGQVLWKFYPRTRN